MKLQIGEQEFNLKEHNEYIEINGSGNVRPTITFNIEATYDEVKPLIIENQTYHILFDDNEIKDVSDYNIFYSCKNIENNKCELIMSKYSDVELLQKTIDDLLEV